MLSAQTDDWLEDVERKYDLHISAFAERSSPRPLHETTMKWVIVAHSNLIKPWYRADVATKITFP
jgi:hypothetical protein